MDHTIEMFKSGIQNFLSDEVIADDAAQDSSGWITQDGRIKLSPGRLVLGTIGSAGQIRGLWVGYKTDGTQVLYRKTETALQYYDGSAWQNILTGLISGSEMSFANYSSLAGAFTFFNSVDGYWKINNANPSSAIQMYDSTKNFHGKILIDRGRTLLYNRRDTNTTDLTGLYGSRIDPQNATVYTTVSSEAIGNSGSTIYSGTLAFKSGHATRNCFGVQIIATVAAGTETFSDNFNGVLTSNLGGTGTINYATGDYSVTFSAVTTGNATGNYQWEDSNLLGLTDFTHTATRLAGEGFIVPQDEGGDQILKVLIGQSDTGSTTDTTAYYSIKQNSVYRFQLDQTDLNPINEVFYRQMGLPSPNAAVSTQKGIVFINTANPEKPEFTVLTKSPLGAIVPDVLFPGFKFSNYDYSDCYFDTYERFITVSCKKSGSANNDTILLCNVGGGTVDAIPYAARMFAHDTNENLYVGSPFTQTVEQILNGFDDEGDAIQNYWISKGERYGNMKLRAVKWRFISETLKKIRRIKLRGLISASQIVQVYISYDDGGFQLFGTIRGDGPYVDSGAPNVIGSNFIGGQTIGGGSTLAVFPFFWEMKAQKPPKFRKRTLKIVATEIGYIDFQFASDWDILLFENRIPARFRQKQVVRLDGSQANPI